MIVKQGEIKKYLEDFHAGKIKPGLEIGCQLDDYIRFKKGTFNMILGHDNVGKTYWRCWYYLVLSIKYGMTWCIWTGENKAGQIVRDLVQMYAGKKFKELSIAEVYRYEQEISQWFTFIDNKQMYKYNELLDLFSEEDYNGCLIDPYTGLDRRFSHSDNYEFLNTTRQWVNQTGKTIDVCTHPSTASGRAQGVYQKGHVWEGHLKEPYKADTEGGKPFANRCDDFIILHRLTKHADWKYSTLIYIDKIKDIETGGQVTEFDKPIICKFNYGLGFTVDGTNPLIDKHIKPVEGYQQKALEVNKSFSEKVKDKNDKQQEIDNKFGWADEKQKDDLAF